MTLGPPVRCQHRSGLDRRVRHPVLTIEGPDQPPSAHLRDRCSPRQALVAPVGARQIPIAPAEPGAPIPRLPSLAAFERRPGRARGCARAGPASCTLRARLEEGFCDHSCEAQRSKNDRERRRAHLASTEPIRRGSTLGIPCHEHPFRTCAPADWLRSTSCRKTAPRRRELGAPV
jgi:hypothetical protein